MPVDRATPPAHFQLRQSVIESVSKGKPKDELTNQQLRANQVKTDQLPTQLSVVLSTTIGFSIQFVSISSYDLDWLSVCLSLSHWVHADNSLNK